MNGTPVTITSCNGEDMLTPRDITGISIKCHGCQRTSEYSMGVEIPNHCIVCKEHWDDDLEALRQALESLQREIFGSGRYTATLKTKGHYHS